MSSSKIQNDSHLTGLQCLPWLFCQQPTRYMLLFLPLQLPVTEVNPKSAVVCVWTFETNGRGQQSRDNPSRLCKYQSACLELNVNALIWNANCVLCDMSKHWSAALWDGKLKASLSVLLIPTGPFDCKREQTGACLLNFRNICGYRALVYQRSKQSHGVCFSSCKDVKTMILHKKAWKTSDGIQGVTGAAKLLQALVQHACFRFVCAYCGATELHRPGCRASSLNMYISSCFTKVGNFGNGVHKHGPPHFCSTVPNSKRQQVGELLMSQLRCAHLEPMAAGGASVVSCENAVTFELCLW